MARLPSLTVAAALPSPSAYRHETCRTVVILVLLPSRYPLSVRPKGAASRRKLAKAEVRLRKLVVAASKVGTPLGDASRGQARRNGDVSPLRLVPVAGQSLLWPGRLRRVQLRHTLERLRAAVGLQTRLDRPATQGRTGTAVPSQGVAAVAVRRPSVPLVDAGARPGSHVAPPSCPEANVPSAKLPRRPRLGAVGVNILAEVVGSLLGEDGLSLSLRPSDILDIRRPSDRLTVRPIALPVGRHATLAGR